MADGSTLDPEGMGKMRVVFDFLSLFGLQLSLTVVLVFLCIFFVLKGGIVYLGNIYKITVQQFFVKKIRLDMLHSMINIRFKKFITSDSGRIQNTMSGEVSRLSMSLTYYLGTLQNIVMVGVYVIFAILINAKFSLLVTVGGYITNFIFKNIYTVTKKESSNLTRESNLYQGLLIQFVSNFKYLRATGSVDILETKLSKQIEQIEKNNRKLGMLSTIVTSVREPSMIVVVVLAILFQTKVLGGSLSSILVSLLFFYRALSSLLAVQTQWNSFLTMSGSMENMKDFQETIETHQEKFGTRQIKRFQNQLRLENASLTYGDKTVLDSINISICKNENIAFVGESGSGKTSLLNVLCGLIPLDKGSYYIDEQNYLSIDMRSLQKRIGYITQEPVIFNATIFENVSFWAEKTEENLLRFQESLEKAALEDFVNELKEKEDTMLGNNGVNVSGGQKQRISIARELYKDVDILIMDEATSALDSETERAIQDSIECLKGSYTLLMVAHRLSTIKSADRIFVMKGGSICEAGNYDTLIEDSVTFRRMVELQAL